MPPNGPETVAQDLPPSNGGNLLLDLQQLRQKKSAAAYGARFKAIAGRLGWDDPVMKRMFYEGLKNNVKDVLCMKDVPATLDEYISMAVEIDNRLYARRLEKRQAAQ